MWRERERRFERRERKDGGGAAAPLTAAAVKTGDGGAAISTRSPKTQSTVNGLIRCRRNFIVYLQR
ncbi:hypothetical protein HanOQP8_Chr10g0374701 [Helianthus annuus]|nr:hypothetical protein HanHA89_Chr10g0393911 [Helianthus annuus]KAJ0701020.1 hypothetical protein HanOQP8_Chr10g0374701 [Helianthus annuus]